MKSNILLVALAVIFMSSCKSDSKFKEMELLDNGSYYGVIKEGDQSKPVQVGDVIFIKQIMMTEKDSVLYDSRTMLQQGEPPYAVKIEKPAYVGDFFEALLRLHIGDSVAIALRNDSLFSNYYQKSIPDFLKGTEFIKYYIKVDSIIPKEKVAKIEAERELQRKQLLVMMEAQEDSLITDYISKNKITTKPDSLGLYFTETKKGNGNLIKAGDTVSVNYVGKFVDGTVFDESKSHPDVFEFPAGTGRVIPGWDMALLKMRQGSKANLVIPSALAYGAQGIPPNIPPYATLIFEMEVVKVKAAQ